MKHFLLLFLLAIVIGIASAVQYKQQVIAILQGDEAIERAARFLQNKHETISQHVVKWNPDTMMFDQVSWNNDLKVFEPIRDPQPIPIGGSKDIMKWSETRIQVVGHGDFSDFTKEVTIGGAKPEDIIDRIALLSKGNNIGRISIVGCTRNAEIAEKQAKRPRDHPGYKLTEKFMNQLKAKRMTSTEVSVRSALVSVDHNGRKLTGRLYRIDYKGDKIEIGIEWSHKKSSEKYIGSFDRNKIKIRTEDVKTPVSIYHFGILPPNSEVHITRPTAGADAAKSSYKVTDDDAFKWVDRMASSVYNSIDSTLRPKPQPRKVQFLKGARGLVDNQPVQEIRNIKDLLYELKHYGDLGPTGGRPANEPTTGAILEDTNNAICYRFGDWVLRMNLDDFYVSVEGIVVSDSDSDEKKELVNELKNGWTGVPPDYHLMEPKVTTSFFNDISSWIGGQPEKIKLTHEHAYNAQSGTAMFISESIRSFQNHFTNMMSLDLVHQGYLDTKLFFNSHPMARGGTWQIHHKGVNNPKAGKLMTGLDMLRDPRARTKEFRRSTETIERISQIAKTWLSHVATSTAEGSRGPKPEHTSKPYVYKPGRDILDIFESIGFKFPREVNFLRDYELQRGSGRLITSTATLEPEIESVNTQIREFDVTEDISLPLKSSIALANDHAYVSDQIARVVERKEQQTGKMYEVLPDSLEYNKNENSVIFKVKEEGNPSSQPEEILTRIDTSKLASEDLLDNVQRQSEKVNKPLPIGKPGGRIEKINKGLAIYGVVRGLAGSIEALENGNTKEGIIGAAQSLHGLGELRGYNQRLYKAAGKFLGRALRSSVNNAAESVTTIAGEDAGRLVQASGGEIISTIGKVGEVLEDIPIIGTAFGVYNIYEDFQQHSTLGYIDAALDIAITGLSLLGPETLPVVVALTIVRMGIDSFYNEISMELNKLPPDATVTQKIGAVYTGIGKAVVDLYEQFTLPGQIYSAIENSHKLDEQYNSDRALLEELSNYNNYFSIVKRKGSKSREINFAGGSQSWNGGNIEFTLGEDGQSTLALQAVSSSGRQIDETHHVNTDGVQDIVLGIGESHSISFKTESVKFLWFIPVHSKTVISGTTGERDTLHGSYHGNSKDNNFIAVQHLPPKTSGLKYNLYDYYYELYGEGGNDSFYLGPQHSYVEGNDGQDTYFISDVSVYTEINNYANDGVTDFMIINLNFDQLSAMRENSHVHITSTNMHMVKIDNWFLGSAYQHMVFKTVDGVLFKISVTSTNNVELMAYALNGAGTITPLTLDAREHGLSEVMTIIGSDYDDTIYGNDLSNHINGKAGDDLIKGGNGEDIYTIDLGDGVDTIDNYATDAKVDVLIFPAELRHIVATSQPINDHLYLRSNGDRVTEAIIKNWFVGKNNRHLLLVSQDAIVVNVSSTKISSVPLQPIFADMSLEQEQFFGGGYTRKLDLTADPILSEVVTIFGSDGNDWMIGNHKSNYMTGGRGSDKMEGKEGADTYVVKRGDGVEEIVNYATDLAVDTILFDANFDDITLRHADLNLIISSGQALHVTLVDWYSGVEHQHVVVRSADGVVFELPNNIDGTIQKTAKVLDYSKKTNGEFIELTDEWRNVQRVLGSQGSDRIIGNSLSNYIDPNAGSFSAIQGNDGSDTYMIKSNYGNTVINNNAADNHPDTLLYSVPFFSINAQIAGNDLTLTSNTGGKKVTAMLRKYIVNTNFQHLTVISDDGISFVLPEAANFKPVPITINRAHSNAGQHINLTGSSSFTEVRTVYGSNQYQNNIIGNDQNNTIVGGRKSDYLEGRDGNDVLKGGNGNDVINGGPGADTIVGGDGNDVINGGEDDDIIAPGLGTNSVNGGPGFDTVIYSGDVDSEDGIHLKLAHGVCIHSKGATEDQLVSIENGFGTEFADMLEGDDEDNVLVGLGGDDRLSPGAGYDVLNGGKGKDIYDLSAANGTVTVENYATDKAVDKVIMTYSKKADLRYEKLGNDLVVRVIHPVHSVFYDPSKPTVIFKGWYINLLYQHAFIQALDDNVSIRSHADRVASNGQSNDVSQRLLSAIEAYFVRFYNI